MNKIKRAAEQDDPYADYWMIRIREKLEQSRAALASKRPGIPSCVTKPVAIDAATAPRFHSPAGSADE